MRTQTKTETDSHKKRNLHFSTKRTTADPTPPASKQPVEAKVIAAAWVAVTPAAATVAMMVTAAKAAVSDANGAAPIPLQII